MAKEAAPAEAKPAAEAAAPPAKGGLSIKMILIAAGVFLVQIVIVYFLAVKFIAPARGGGGGHEESAKEEKSSEGEAKKGEKEEKGGESGEALIFVVKDLIVNPAGTNGTRFLLTTVGFEVSSAEAVAELGKKEMVVRDALTNILSAKQLAELTNAEQREAIRTEISEKISAMLKSGKLKNIYFSKFIIQ
jgi:flagellar basal body-associated protein FliL